MEPKTPVPNLPSLVHLTLEDAQPEAQEGEAIFLGPDTPFIRRTDPRSVSGYAIACYKSGWDEAICYSTRGVPAAQYLEHMGELRYEAIETRVAGMAIFLPMPMLRKLAAKYTAGPMQHVSQVEPPHDPFEYYIRGDASYLPELAEWTRSQTPLLDFLSTLPAAALELARPAASELCKPGTLRLNEEVCLNAGLPRDVLDELLSKSEDAVIKAAAAYRPNGSPDLTIGEVYPLYHCLWTLVELSRNALPGSCVASQRACTLTGHAVTRMSAALNRACQKVVLKPGVKMWRGVRAERYAWVEAAATTPKQWEERLIKTLQSTYFSASTDKCVAVERFLGEGGILIEFEGDCRGINTNEALLPPWGCFQDEKEVLVAPDQRFEVVKGSHKANEKCGEHASVTTIKLKVSYVRSPETPVWVDDKDDPHFEMRA
tara:strand:- start:1236 stop:2525 length:1290 start_codon:yes stop_codon:yes gene_type:complete